MIAVFVGIFVGSSMGCESRGNETHLEIWNCNSDSFRELMRSFERESIVQLRAELYQNNTFQTIDAELFRDMRNLVELKLITCGIENVTEDAFSDLKSLTQLDLSLNRIKKLNEKVFWSLEKLEILLACQ